MRARAFIATAAAAVVLAGTGTAAALAGTAKPAPAAQPDGNYAYACVNRAGGIDYLEFRGVIPHACWFDGESLWKFAVTVPVPEPPAPTATATPAN